MKLYKFGLPFAALALLASCSNDKLDGPNIDNNVDGVDVTVTFSQLLGTRSATTESMSEEVGKDYENGIDKVLLILTDGSDKILAYSSTTAGNASEQGVYTVSANFEAKPIVDYLGSTGAEMRVFVIANPSSIVNTAPIQGTDIQQVLTVSAITDLATANTNNSFVMTGCSASETKTISSTTTGQETRKNLEFGSTTTPIKISRIAARFDLCMNTTGFDDASNGKYDSESQALVYSAPDSKVKLKIDQIALINMSKNCNLYKEVGERDGQSGIYTKKAGWQYFGSEYDATATKYVFDPYDNEKASLLVDHDTYFFYSPFSTTGETSAKTATQKNPEDFFPPANGSNTVISTLTTSGNSFQNPALGEIPTGATYSDYKIWRYCVPNTLIDETKQLNGNSTGVYFRAEITTADETLSAAMTSKNALYCINNTLYTASQLEENLDGGNIYAGAKTAVGGETQSQEDIDAKLVELYRVKIFRADDEGKYYTYYPYWNVHNAAPGEKMGPMEFAVVRNNVYKLAVTSIKNFGHPGKTPDDPDPIDPDDPDKKEMMDIVVYCSVLPWTVRVNNIEF